MVNLLKSLIKLFYSKCHALHSSIRAREYAGLVIDAYHYKPPTDYNLLTLLPDSYGWIVEKSEDTVIIVLRGTMDIKDWMVNAEMELVSNRLGSVHKGFWDNSLNLMPTIESALIDIEGLKKVIVTGHSLGAAMAVIIAALLRFNMGNGIEISTYLFACPRVGTASFIAKYKELLIDMKLYKNKKDIVPLVPEGLGYTEFEGAIEFDDGILGDIPYNHSIKLYHDNI